VNLLANDWGGSLQERGCRILCIRRVAVAIAVAVDAYRFPCINYQVARQINWVYRQHQTLIDSDRDLKSNRVDLAPLVLPR